MGARNVTESTVLLIKNHIKSNIDAALSELRVDRNDPKVTTEPPKDYFIYEMAHAYKTPAVFIIASNVDLLKSAGPNAIMANVRVNVSVVVEDTDKEKLTIKAYRYQDALFSVLDQAQIVSLNNNVKLVVVAKNFTFSPMFTMNTDARASVNTFRKEVLVECDVAHFEQP